MWRIYTRRLHSPSLICPFSVNNMFSGCTFYSLKNHARIYTVDEIATVDVIQPQETATRDLAYFVLRQLIPMR